MSGHAVDGGVRWVLGAAGANTFPTDGQGTGSATNSASELAGAKEVTIYGIMIYTLAGGAGVASICDNGGTAVPGLSVDAFKTGWYPFANGVTYYSATQANVGLTLPATAVGAMFYRKNR